MREFAGKTAVVTGAASGMGLAFARRFAAEGMNVVLADIEEEALEAQVRQLEQEERAVLGVVVNTMRREALEELRDRTIAEYGNIHILCNNAGVTSREDAGLGAGNGGLAVWEVPDSTWDWVMGVNFWGVLYGLQVFMPHMHGHGEEGHIVNTASVAGLIPGGSAYSVSKHGVLTLTEGLHGQLKLLGSKIGASVLCPGFVNTKIAEAERNRPAEFGEKLTEMTDEQTQAVAAILGSGMDPADVAELVFNSIVEERCYILPHAGWDEVVRSRVEHIIGREAPVTVDFEDLVGRRAAGEQI